MATTSGIHDLALTPQPDPFDLVLRLLEDEPFRVHFFQAVRLLQQREGNRGHVGHFSQPQDETIRFSSLPSLAFPASELFDLEHQTGGQWKMTVQFMGLCSALSALPSVYTEAVLTRIREKDRAMADFFDMFNHRMISLFYRAWEKHHAYVAQEARSEEKLTQRLLDVLGLGTEGMGGRSGVSDRSCIFYAGLLGRHIRTADSLQQLLEDFFDVPVRIDQFAGTWRTLPRDSQSFLNSGRDISERLGVGTIVGDEVWDHHGRIQVTLGPMNFEQYQGFLPGQSGHRELTAWTKLYSNGSYETQVRLILKRDEVPACTLDAPGSGAARLGLVSWLKTRPRTTDAGEAHFLL